LNVKTSTRKCGRGRGKIVLAKSLGSCPRFVSAKLAYTKHLRRVALNISQSAGLTQESRDVVKEIVDLMMWFGIDSHYAEIRKLAQNVVSSVLKVHPYLMGDVYPLVIDALGEGGSADRMKGALFMINRSGFSSYALKSWKAWGIFVMGLLKGYHEDKPSVQKRIRKLLPDFMRKFNQIEFARTGFWGECVSGYVMDVIGADDEADLPEYGMMKARVDRAIGRDRKAYDDLIEFLVGHLGTPNLHWFYTASTISLIENVIKREVPVREGLVQTVMQCLLSDIRAVRNVSVSLLKRVCMFIKDRSMKISGTSRVGELKRTVDFKEIVGSGDEFTDMFRRACYSDVLFTKEEWTTMRFIDNQDVGWYCFPSTAVSYSAAGDSDELPFSDLESKEAVDVLLVVLKTAEFWDKWFAFVSLEAGEREAVGLGVEMLKLYKSLFGMFQDHFIDLVIPHVVRLAGVIDEKSCQRAAAECIAGLITGTRYWGFEKLEKMWGWVIPLIEKVIGEATPEVLVYWESLVKVVCAKRDLRRFQPLIHLILRNSKLDPTSESFFTESKKLSLVKGLIVDALIISFDYELRMEV
jgi:proteasome activator subunit 4